MRKSSLIAMALVIIPTAALAAPKALSVANPNASVPAGLDGSFFCGSYTDPYLSSFRGGAHLRGC